MRDIKFRAWDEENKYMKYDDIYPKDQSWPHDWENSFDVCLRLVQTEYKLMQFSGLKDRKEIDIYEGDIVLPFTDQKTKAQIIFMKGCFKIATKTIEGNYHIWNYFQSEIEVIGNIYENPERL